MVGSVSAEFPTYTSEDVVAKSTLATGTLGKLYLSELHMYGSSRLGIWSRKVDMDVVPPSGGTAPLLGTTGIDTFNRGNKFFELANHLGNVLVTVSDRKVGQNPVNGLYSSYTAEVVSASDYAPFGMQMVGRTFDAAGATAYRYGFNSHERSDEIAGKGNHTSALFGEYDTRLGRRWNPDPKPNTEHSFYSVFGNSPIWNNDILLDTPTVRQAAQMSNDAYNTYDNRQKISGGWQRVQKIDGVKFEDKATDFQSALYSRTINGKTEFTFATAGTASGRDAWQDAIQTVGASGQYAFSIEQAKALNGLLQGQELTFTGHSLGGGTASANALATGNPAITFNAAGVSILTKTREGLLSASSSKIRAFIIPGEAVDFYQGIIGSTAEGKHEYVHPVFGKMGNNSAQIVKERPQTVFVRARLHMMSLMFSALDASGYTDKVPIQFDRLELNKRPQDADNTINRQGVPVFMPKPKN